jgi:capsular polysaccharide biosynthesis protein
MDSARRDPLRDVFVNHDGLIFRRGRIYRESFVSELYVEHMKPRRARYAWFLLKNHWLRRGAVAVPSALWVIDNFSPGNYHHWLLECLPRILHAEELYPHQRVLLLPRAYRQYPYVRFTLGAFPRIHRVGWIGRRVKARVGQLAVVPRDESYRSDRLGEVARRVATLAGEPSSARRVYLSRADAARRHARNESDVVRVLRSYDFEIVEIDPRRPWEQVRASRGATVMVGVHGAALSSLIFMEPGNHLLELRHPYDEVFFDAYRPLAAAMGIRYRPQFCKPVGDFDFEELERAGALSRSELVDGVMPPSRSRAMRPFGDRLYEVNNLDLEVDLDALRVNLDQITK